MAPKIALGVFVTLISLSSLSSCGQQSADELFAAGEAAAADPAGLAQAETHFKAFVEQFASDPKAPEALKKLAALAQQQDRMEEAIGYYRRVLAEYPDSGHGDEAQFMIAFIYEEYIRDVDKARSAYQLVIDQYPDSELAASARHLLPNVGRNPEEWVEFQDRAATP